MTELGKYMSDNFWKILRNNLRVRLWTSGGSSTTGLGYGIKSLQIALEDRLSTNAHEHIEEGVKRCIEL